MMQLKLLASFFSIFSKRSGVFGALIVVSFPLVSIALSISENAKLAAVGETIVLTDEEELLPEAFPFEISQAPIELNVGSPLKEASDTFRTTFISNTLKSTGGNRTKAAKILGVQRSYLSRLLKELGIK